MGFLLSALLVAMLTLPVLGQANGGGGGDNGNGNGNGNNGNGMAAEAMGWGRRLRRPARSRPVQQQMMDRLKTQLGASDDEFAAIQPKIQAVMQLQRDVDHPIRACSAAAVRWRRWRWFWRRLRWCRRLNPRRCKPRCTDLQTTLDDQNASPMRSRASLTRFRQAKAKARQDLIVAQQDLKSVLTQRQEAVMVLMDISTDDVDRGYFRCCESGACR